MCTLSRVLRLSCGNYCGRDKAQSEVLCAELFAELMDLDSLPKRIRVTVSTRSIRGAARVPVMLSMEDGLRPNHPFLCGKWIDWHGNEEPMWDRAAKYLKQLGVPLDEWTDIWVDWAPV